MSALEDYEVLETSEKALCEHILSLTSLDLYVTGNGGVMLFDLRSFKMVLRAL